MISYDELVKYIERKVKTSEELSAAFKAEIEDIHYNYSDDLTRFADRLIENMIKAGGEERFTWLVAVTNSAATGIKQMRVAGTEREIRHYLMGLLKEDHRNDRHNWIDGGVIAKEENGYSVYGQYNNDEGGYEIYYVATKEMPITILE